MNWAFSIVLYYLIYPTGLHDEHKQPCRQGVSSSINWVLPTGKSVIYIFPQRSLKLNLQKEKLLHKTLVQFLFPKSNKEYCYMYMYFV